MPTGRPRKPAAIHVREGTYRADRHAEADPLVPVAAAVPTKPPASLPKDVAPEWHAVATWLSSVGIVKEADLALLAEGLVELHNARAAQKEIDKIQRKRSLAADDYAHWTSLTRIRSQAMSAYLQVMSRFAIGPSDSAKFLHLMPKPKKPAEKSIKSIIAKGKK